MPLIHTTIASNIYIYYSVRWTSFLSVYFPLVNVFTVYLLHFRLFIKYLFSLILNKARKTSICKLERRWKDNIKIRRKYIIKTWWCNADRTGSRIVSSGRFWYYEPSGFATTELLCDSLIVDPKSQYTWHKLLTFHPVLRWSNTNYVTIYIFKTY
jgi:hypothetical protein